MSNIPKEFEIEVKYNCRNEQNFRDLKIYEISITFKNDLKHNNRNLEMSLVVLIKRTCLFQQFVSSRRITVYT